MTWTTTPTTTVEGADAIVQIVALQAQRIVRMEASLRRIEKLLEQDRPHEAEKGGVTP